MHYEYYLTSKITLDNYMHLTSPYLRYQLLTMKMEKTDLEEHR